MGDVYEENILNLGVGMKGGLTGFQGGGGRRLTSESIRYIMYCIT